MTFTIPNGGVTRCAGQNHYRITLTINGNTFTLHTSLGELQDAAPEGFEESRERIVQRIRARLLDQNATTFAASRTALEGQTFKV